MQDRFRKVEKEKERQDKKINVLVVILIVRRAVAVKRFSK